MRAAPRNDLYTAARVLVSLGPLPAQHPLVPQGEKKKNWTGGILSDRHRPWPSCCFIVYLYPPTTVSVSPTAPVSLGLYI